MSSEAAGRIEPVRRRTWPRRAGLYALLVAIAIPLLFPIYWMASASLKPRFEILKFPPTLFPSSIRWENYAEVFTEAPFLLQYWNSLYIGVLNTVSVLIVSSLAGYAFARMKFRMRNLLFILLLSALLMPEEVLILPLFVMMRQLDWIGTHIPLLLVPAFAVPAVTGTFLMRQFFLSLPAELEDAGRVDGLGTFGIFWYIALPLSMPALATLGILTFLQSWNSFLEPLIFVGGRSELLTLPLAIFQYTEFGGEPIWANQLAAATLSAVPMIIVFLFAQRYVIQGISTSGIKG
jgi:multiple sugar transport system permease protein